MNSIGDERGYIVKSLSVQEFFHHVVGCVERKLKEWDSEYQVYIVKLADYNLIVKKGCYTYSVDLSEEEIESLQKCGGYALDREIWRQLERKGVAVRQES